MIGIWQTISEQRAGCDFRNAIFNLIFHTGIFRSFFDNVFSWMPWHLTDDTSTLVQVMAWCSQATSRYLSQCWPRSMSPYGVTRPQWFKSINTIQNYMWLVLIFQLKLADAYISQWTVIFDSGKSFGVCSSASHNINLCWLIPNFTPGHNAQRS